MAFEFEKMNTRVVFGDTVYQAAKKDDSIIFISGDCVPNMGAAEMEKAMPDRVINMGIAEQNTMGAAAGLAAVGLKPVVGGIAAFSTMRSLEQFRTFVAYPNLDVLVCGGMAGLSASTEGVTHQGTEDYGIMRMIPNTVVAVPCDCVSTKAITEALLAHKGPAYMRVGKMNYKKVYEEGEYTFELGKANWLKTEGTDATIITCGATVPNCLMAWEELAAEGINVKVIDMASLKPIDKEAIVKASKETGAIVTVEDHVINGGLGSAVAEVLCEEAPALMTRLAIPDVFARSGDHYELLDHYGMGVKDIKEAVKKLIEKKK